jgi:hypothetical protein
MNVSQRRMELLKRMSQIQRMEKGRLTAEYREAVRDGKTVRLGPYYKHQFWEDGRNISRRVPEKDVESLREAVEGFQQFEAMAQEFSRLTVEETRRATQPDSKKKN